MDDSVLTAAAAELKKDWGLALPETISEEAIISLLAARLVKVMEQGAEVFYQLMYRLDIPEQKLNAAAAGDHAPEKIARLIFDRQMQKARSRSEHPRAGQWPDADLKW